MGSAIIAWGEANLRQRGPDTAWLVLIETSSADTFARTRSFYRKHGFTLAATIRDYYGPGKAKVVFWKSLQGQPDEIAPDDQQRAKPLDAPVHSAKMLP